MLRAGSRRRRLGFPTGERLDVQRLAVLSVDPVVDAAQPREVAQVLPVCASTRHPADPSAALGDPCEIELGGPRFNAPSHHGAQGRSSNRSTWGSPIQATGGPASRYVRPLTFWDGRQPVIGPVRAVRSSIPPAATSAAAAAEEPQKEQHQQQCEKYDDHDHVGSPEKTVEKTVGPSLSSPYLGARGEPTDG